MPTPRIHKKNELQPHFLTITVVEWINVFTKAEYFNLLAQSLNWCIENKRLKVYCYVFMTNHIHLIVGTKEKDKLVESIKSFKQFTTLGIEEMLTKDNRKYIKKLIEKSSSKKKSNKFQVWQEGNFPFELGGNLFDQKLYYIHDNPVREGYVNRAEDWRYSSAGDYFSDRVKSPVKISLVEL